jgi:ABC-type Co2+ transport system permease subunit
MTVHIRQNREMATGDEARDPGWRSALGGLWWVLVPGQMIRQQRRAMAAGTNGLTVLRRLFASFVAALIMIGLAVVLLSATTTQTHHPLAPVDVAIGVVVYGVFSVFAPRLIEKPLDCSADQRLAGTYRTRFFLRLAFANAAALLGFVGFMLSNNGWFYVLGVAFAAIGFYRVAPSAAHLAKDQQALSDSSCSRSLIAALATLPPPASRSRQRNSKR